MVTELLEVRDARVRFKTAEPLLARLAGRGQGYIDAVAGISFTVRKGETFALVGESGSGKSTLARAINGLVPAQTGSSFRFDGTELTTLSPAEFRSRRKHMVMMFQDPVGSLSPRLAVRALLAEPFQAHGLGHRDLAAEACRLLALVGLPDSFLDRYPHELSGGQARRVGLARAIALEPKLLIADEPTAGLDVSVQGEVLNLLNAIQDRMGLSILIITHNLHVVRHVAHRTAIMYLGRFVEEGPTEAIFRSPRHPYTKALLSAGTDHIREELSGDHALAGEVPSLKRRPKGCEFHPRCPFVRPLCRTAAPVTTAAGEHRFTCHFPLADGVPSKRAPQAAI